MRKTLFKELFLFIFGALTYVNIEIIFRGYSHWSMGIVGGLCFIIIGLLNEFYKWEMLFQWQCLIGAGVITVIEFISGCILNLWLHWNIWDYSDMSLNILGQVSLHHTVLYWIPLSAVAIFVDDILRSILFNEDFPHYSLKKKNN